MTSNVIDQPSKADEDRLNMKAYTDALTEFDERWEQMLFRFCLIAFW